MENQYECENCNKRFDTESGLNQHNNSKHVKINVNKLSMKTFRKPALYAILSLVIVGIAYGIYSLVSATYTAKAVATSLGLPNAPIHWHPNLEIIVNDGKITIPANIGIGLQYSSSPHYDPMMRMTNIHTHDSTGKLHWEVMRVPKPADLYLGNFFQVWDKAFNSNCIFEYCNGLEGSVKMFVNGNPNYDFEKYIVRDGDKIQIVYE